jgi:hypothetical protein
MIRYDEESCKLFCFQGEESVSLGVPPVRRSPLHPYVSSPQHAFRCNANANANNAVHSAVPRPARTGPLRLSCLPLRQPWSNSLSAFPPRAQPLHTLHRLPAQTYSTLHACRARSLPATPTTTVVLYLLPARIPWTMPCFPSPLLLLLFALPALPFPSLPLHLLLCSQALTALPHLCLLPPASSPLCSS